MDRDELLKEQARHLRSVENWAKAQRKIGGTPVVQALTYELVQMVHRASRGELRPSQAVIGEWGDGRPEKIVLTSSGSTLLPVIKLLAEKGCGFVTLRPEYAQTLKNLDLPAKAAAELATPDVRRRGFGEAAKLLRTVKKFPKDGLRPDALTYLDADLHGFLMPRIPDLSILPLVLDGAGVDLVLLHNDVEPLTRLAALWARKAGVPCLHVPHAVYMDEDDRGAPGEDVHDLITASHLAAAGSFQREWYGERGFPTSGMRETGLPQFDPWATMSPDRERARRLLKLDHHRPVLTYFSSWGQQTNLLGCHAGMEQTYIAFLDAIREMPQFQYIVKVHPRGNNLPFHGDAAKAAGVRCVLTATHWNIVLQATDALLSYGPSNVILDAAHLPGVRLMATHGFRREDVVRKTGTDAAGMRLVIVEALARKQPDATEFLFRYAGIPDGKAAERVADFAWELLNEG